MISIIVRFLHASNAQMNFNSPDWFPVGAFCWWWKMEISLGDKIKINGEEVPEYLLKALHEHLKLRYCLKSEVEYENYAK